MYRQFWRQRDFWSMAAWMFGTVMPIFILGLFLGWSEETLSNVAIVGVAVVTAAWTYHRFSSEPPR